MENMSENCQMVELPRLHPSAYSWLYNSCTILSLAEYVREDDFLTPPNTPLVPPNSPTEGVRPRASAARSYASSSWETTTISRTKERSNLLESLARKYVEERHSSRGSKRYKVRDEIAAWELWRTRMLAYRAPDPPFLFPLRMNPLPPFENKPTSMQGQRRRMSPTGSYYTRGFSRSFSSTNSPFVTQTRHDYRSNSFVASPHTLRGSSIDTMRTLGNVESLKSEFNTDPNSTNDLMCRSFHWKERTSDRHSRNKLQGGDSSLRRVESNGIKRTLSTFEETGHYERKKRMLAQLSGSGDGGKVGRSSCLEEYIAVFKDTMRLDRSNVGQAEVSQEEPTPIETPERKLSHKDSENIVVPSPSRENRYRKMPLNSSLSRIKEKESTKNIVPKKSTGATVVLHKNHDYKEQSEVTKSRCTTTYWKTEDEPPQNVSLLQKTKSTSFLDTHSVETVLLADTSTVDTSDPIHKRRQVIATKKTQYQDILLNERKPLNKNLFASCIKKPSTGRKLESYSRKTCPHSPLDAYKKQKYTKNSDPTENVAAPESVENKITAIKEMLHQPLVRNGADVDAGESSTLCSRSGRRKNYSTPPPCPHRVKLTPKDSDSSLQSVITLKRKKLSKGGSNSKTKDSEPNKQMPPKRKEAIARQTSVGSKNGEDRILITSRLHQKKMETCGKSFPKGKLRFSVKDNQSRKIHTIDELNEFGGSEKEKALSDTSNGKDSLKKRLRALNIDKSTTILRKQSTEGVLPTFLSSSLNELQETGKQEKSTAASTNVRRLSGKEESVSSKTNISDGMNEDSASPNSTLINYIHHHIKMNSSLKDSNDLLSKLQITIEKEPLRPGFGGAKTRCHDWQWNEELIYQSPDELSDMSYMSEYFRRRQNLKSRKGLRHNHPDSGSEKEIQVSDLQTEVASPQLQGDASASAIELKTKARPGSSGSDIIKTVSTPVDNASNLRHFIIPGDEDDEKVGDTMEKFKNIHKLKTNETGKNLWKVLKESCIGKRFRFPSRTIKTIKESSDDPMKSLYMSDDSTNLFSDDDKSLEVGGKVGYWPEKSDEDENTPLECPKHKPSRPFYWPNDPRRKIGSKRYGINLEETHPQFNSCIRSLTDLSNMTELRDDTSIQIVKGSNYTDTANFTEETTDLSLSFTFSDSSSIHRMDSTLEQTEGDSLTELNDASRVQTQSSMTEGRTQTPVDLTDICPIETLALTRSKVLLPSRPHTPTLPPEDLYKEETASKKSEATTADLDELKKACSSATHESDETRSGLLFDGGQWTFVPPTPPPPHPRVPPSGLRDSAERMRAIKSLSQEWRLDLGRKRDSPKASQGNVPGIRHAIFDGKRININDYSFDAPYLQLLQEYQSRNPSKPMSKIPPHILRHLKKAVVENDNINVGVNKLSIKRPSMSTPRASTTAVQNPSSRSIPKEVSQESGNKSPSSRREPQPMGRTSAHGIAFPSSIVVNRLKKETNQSTDQSHTPDAQVTPGTSVEHLPQTQVDTPVTRKKRPRRKAKSQMHEPMVEEPPGDGVCLMGMTLSQRMSLLNQMDRIVTPFPSAVTCVEEERLSPEAKKMRLEEKGSMSTRPATCPGDRRHLHDALRCANMQCSARINIREPHKKAGGKGSNILLCSPFPPQPAKYKSFPGAMGGPPNKHSDRAFSPLSMIPEATTREDHPRSSESAASKNVSRQQRRMSSRGTDKPTTATSEIVITEESTMSSTTLTNASLRRFSMFSNGNQYWPDGSRHECMDGSWQLQQYREATEKAWKMIAQGKQQAQQKSEANKQKAAMSARFLSINNKPASCIEYLKRRLEEEEKRLHHLTARKKRLSLLDASSHSMTSSLFSTHRNPPSSPTGTISHSGSLLPLMPMTSVTLSPC